MSKVDKNELKRIFQRMRDDDKNSFEELYAKYYNTVFGVAFSILKNNENSEDVTQNVFAKILKMDKNLLPSQGESSWLYTVTKNEVIQFLRKQKSTIDIDDLYTIESENSEIEDFLDMSSYHKLVEELDPLDREIVSLRIISDFTFDKISQMLDIPLGTVQWRYYKALHYVKLSITNLATYIVLITTLQFIKEEFLNLRPEEDGDIYTNTTNTNATNYSVNVNTSNSSNTDTTNSSGGGGISFNSIDTNTVTSDATDTTGASSSVSRMYGAIITLMMIFITILFLIFTLILLTKKKIKKKIIKKIQ